MSQPAIKSEPSTVRGEHSRNEQFKQLVNSYSEHLHVSARPVENARDNGIFKLLSINHKWSLIDL
jgi:hypothetical protein